MSEDLFDLVEVTPGDSPPFGKIDFHPGTWRSRTAEGAVKISEMEGRHLSNALRWVRRAFSGDKPPYWAFKEQELRREQERRWGLEDGVL